MQVPASTWVVEFCLDSISCVNSGTHALSGCCTQRFAQSGGYEVLLNQVRDLCKQVFPFAYFPCAKKQPPKCRDRSSHVAQEFSMHLPTQTAPRLRAFREEGSPGRDAGPVALWKLPQQPCQETDAARVRWRRGSHMAGC